MIHCQCAVPECLRVMSAGGAESVILSAGGAESMMLSAGGTESRGDDSKITKNIVLLLLIFFVGTQDIYINKINPFFF
jgi:hypothetical protein